VTAVVLLSGGLDSAVALAATTGGVDTVTVDYGQSHRREIDAAAEIADHYNVRNTVITIGGLRFDSALTGLHSIPAGRATAPDATYVPGRNTILIALAASRAESIGADRVVIGCNKDDAAAYPDCRPNYLDAYRAVLRAGLNAEVNICAPLINHTKRDIAEMARHLDVPIGLTWSCYRGGEQPCGRCGACHLRREAGA
jgi:7-cyano-7-deazaguanine synthase